MNKPFAITFGDPAGIGPEIIVKALVNDLPEAQALVIGDAALLKSTAERLGLRAEVCAFDPSSPERAPGTLPVLDLGLDLSELVVGKPSALGGEAAFRALTRGIDLAASGQVSALVTAPLSKQALHLAGHIYPGHTEILAEKTKSEVSMALVSPKLKVLLVTVHQALRSIFDDLTEANLLRAFRHGASLLADFGIKKPRIAVAGLNPHAGEDGLFGTEEQTIIAPAVQRAQKEGLPITGPFAPDTIFMRAKEGEFDLVIALYHDQGLIPLKLDGLDQGVNLTVGLPFVRTSPDHGTAFDLAGQGKASAASLIAAIEIVTILTNCQLFSINNN